MKIELRDKVPVSEPYRRVPRQLYGGVKNYVDDLIINGWLEHRIWTIQALWYVH